MKSALMRAPAISEIYNQKVYPPFYSAHIRTT